MPAKRLGYGPSVPFQFEMTGPMHKEALAKSSKYGISMAAVLRIAVQEFIDRPIEQTIQLLGQDPAKRTNKNGRK